MWILLDNTTDNYIMGIAKEAIMKTLTITFSIFWLFILLVSGYDTYLSIKYSSQLYQHELNPVGIVLMDLDDGDVALFMAAKTVGTSLALAFLLLYNQKHPNKGTVVAGVVAFLQLVLFGFLIGWI